MEILGWILALISIIGVVLNIRKKASGFIFYTIANVGWVVVNLHYEIYAQAFLFLVFTGLSIYGWWNWTFKKRRKK
jgi:nicotinamide riboside transporter PnuC